MAYRGRMKYFILEEKAGNPFPQIVNWSQVLNPKKLNRDDYKDLPGFTLLDMKVKMDSFFPDIIISPFLLMARNAMEVTALYDPQIPFRYTALFDTKAGECVSYYCPILEEEDCVCKRCPSGTEISLDRTKMTGFPLFHVTVEGNRKAVIRMDLAESLLEREAVGVELKEVYLAE